MVDLFSLWGKTFSVGGDEGERERIVHPLLCHMIDVAEVIGALWDHALSPGSRRWFSTRLGVEERDCRSWLMAWGALHDLGKACPGFQRRFAPAMPLLASQGLGFPEQIGNEPCYHGTVSTWALRRLLPTSSFGLERRVAAGLAQALGGHHGSWPDPREVMRLPRSQIGSGAWDETRRELCAALSDIYHPSAPVKLGRNRAQDQSFLTLLAGLVSTADWLGSMGDYFPPQPDAKDPIAYAALSREQALAAVRIEGWASWQPPQEAVSFRQLVAYDPRPMQAQVVSLANTLSDPGMVIIEAPTGSGKTEAALYLSDHWARVLGQQGLYIAMPTMATSNQMYDRLCRTVERRYPDAAYQPLLVHSQARWQREPTEVRIEGNGADEGRAQEQGAEAMSWFLPRKRSLLAPIGVGTVDQALLSVLPTRHFFVRLFGLAGKTILFDEVHAYDTYMSTIFHRLLAWLHQTGTSVIMLSATLPEQTRRDLLTAYGAEADVADEPQGGVTGYPAITTCVRGRVQTLICEPPQDHDLHLHWLKPDPATLIEHLRAGLASGGCAAVLCNTVRRAQETYALLKEAHLVPDEDLILFHARYPFAWRDEIERRVLARFGRYGERPERAIVVATQVIEQSLDLDFDLMVSDMAPVDLLLQRAGRLHRHAERTRPAKLRQPCLALVVPEDDSVAPNWGVHGLIYEKYILLRSWLALKGRDVLRIPSETRALIEAVYGEGMPHGVPEPLLVRLQDTWETMMRHMDDDAYQARCRLIADPGHEGLLLQQQPNLAEDDPDVHHALQALTRLGQPSISLVCLHARGELLATEPKGGLVVDPDSRPTGDVTAELARHTVSVSQRALYDFYRRQPVPVGWRRHSLLRNHRLAVFTDGVCAPEGLAGRLVLSRELGLEFEKEDA